MGGLSCSIRRLSVAVLTLFAALEAQVTIRDTIAIDPRSPLDAIPGSAASTSLLRLVHTGFTTVAETTVPGVMISASISVDPPDIPFGTAYELWLSAAGSSYLIRQETNGCPGSGAQPANPFPLTLPSCGWISVTGRTYVPAPFVWSCGLRGTSVDVSVDGNRAIYTVFGTLWYQPLVATVTITASMNPDYLLSSVMVSPDVERLECSGFTPVQVSVLNGLGEAYVPCFGNLTGTAQISASGPYAYLISGSQSGTSVTFGIQNGDGFFLAVLDTSKGIIAGGNDQSHITVDVEGVRSTASLALTCSYPPPTVSITYPASDTTIILSDDNLPVLIFRETHTPSKGQFEPSMSWTPGPILETASYFDQIQDSLVIEVTVTATNVGGTATDERKIVLKKDLDPLHHFDITLANNVVSCDEVVPIVVTAKDKDGKSVEIDSSTPLNILLESNELYGSLLGLDGNSGKHIQTIYAHAVAGLVQFRTECPDPIPPEGRQVKIGVTRVGQETKQGVATITIAGEPELVIVTPTSTTQEVRINAAPVMPTLVATARLKNNWSGLVTFYWYLAVQWKTPEPRVVHDVFQGQTTANNSEITTWTIIWGDRIRGGDDVTLHVTALVDERTYDAEVKNPWKIIGENPGIGVVKDGLAIEDQVLVYKESLPKWSHFRNGLPIFGRPRGYGLMQIDNPRAVDEEIWNWTANRLAGKKLFSEKKAWALTYGRDVRRGRTWFKKADGTYGYNQPIKPHRDWYPREYVQATDLSSNEDLLKESFQRYNGGIWWRWEPEDRDDTKSSGKWIRAFSADRYGDEAWSIYADITQKNKYPPGWNE